MSFPTSTLEAMQRAGAAVFEADAQLKSLTHDYANRVHAAVLANPYHLGNDGLFENWKTVARMSQTLSSMEEELRKMYQLAAEMMQENASASIPVLAAPAPTQPIEWIEPLNVTDVHIKKSAAALKTKRRSARSRNPATAKLRGNAARLLAYLDQHLNAQDFSTLNQTRASKETGIPLGSISAAMKILLKRQLIQAGLPGQFKILG